MKCSKKPFNNKKHPAEITGVMEVLLPHALWERIKIIKKKNFRLTYSWISRYALFRLLRHARDPKSQARLLKNPRFRSLRAANSGSPKTRRNAHRHLVCFYGRDEELVRELSLRLRVSVSSLVVIALLWYLHELEVDGIPVVSSRGAGTVRRFAGISREKIVAFGTKVVSGERVFVRSLYSVPVRSFRRMDLFGSGDFWFMPTGYGMPHPIGL